MYSYRIDYLLFSQGLCLFFIALSAAQLFRRHKVLEWLCYALWNCDLLSTSLCLIQFAVPNTDLLGKASISLHALSLFFLALYGANGMRPGRLRGGAYVLCGILLVVPAAAALIHGAQGFENAATIGLGLVGGALALATLVRRFLSPDAARYSTALYPLLACYILAWAIAPAIHLLLHGLADNGTISTAILPARAYAVAGAVTAAAFAISCARAAAFGRETPTEVGARGLARLLAGPHGNWFRPALRLYPDRHAGRKRGGFHPK
ncbi:hypothetical protein [uncultured Cohaesibacter sp.]|uniref:hypothetical protein n=1 Tax=uncultured Cohaesibacter sp. TaxID=1002546 RepID=UPI0029C60605|nr:hypothetical protein [uncultured Cohaesibacter sp.]